MGSSSSERSASMSAMRSSQVWSVSSITLPVRRRVRLHLLAAEALERLPEAAREKRAAELAWHFLQADEGRRALPYAMVAGDQAEAVFAHTEALRHYRTALELAHAVDDRRREAEALEKLGVVLRLGMQYDQARDVLERAADTYRAVDDPEGEARVTHHIGNVLHFEGAGMTQNSPLEAIPGL